MKLQQNQVWRLHDQFIRIVNLERMCVDYKTMTDLANRTGTHRRITKKEFCRMMKGAVLLTPEEDQVLRAVLQTNEVDDSAKTETDPAVEDIAEDAEAKC